MNNKYRFEIDLNVLNHLGLGLYSSTPAVLTEMVSNSWDADATEVTIRTDPAASTIVIEDDGHGMSDDDIRLKFLKVGYARRTDPKGKGGRSEGGRPVMGRKGIGKLAMFSLCDIVDIATRRLGGGAIYLRANVQHLQAAIAKGESYFLEQGSATPEFAGPKGTRITLSSIHSSIDRSPPYLVRRLARRFSVLGRADFRVMINAHRVVPSDRGFYDKVQFCWTLGGLRASDDIAAFSSIAKKEDGQPFIDTLNPNVSSSLKLEGYIAAVQRPQDLRSGDDNCNLISIFAHGRVFQEDVLKQISNAKYFNSYLFGEIHADFLDEDLVDRAVANRESLKQDDGEVRLLVAHLGTILSQIETKWDVWRRDLGYGKSPGADPAVRDWLNTIDRSNDRKIAERLMLGIYNMPSTTDEVRDNETKRLLYQSTIAAFERLKVRNQLGELESIDSIDSPEFMQLISSIDQLEEAYFWEIVSNRLKVIEDFEQNIVDKGALEKIAQKYLFDHLWLLDPAWERIAKSEALEKDLTEYLKNEVPDSTGARLDIAYRTTSGKHLVIELKRPGKTSLDPQALIQQVTKYQIASRAYFTAHPDTEYGIPTTEVCLLVEEDVFAKSPGREVYYNQLKAANARVVTYTGLLTNAKRAYQDFLNARPALTKIEEIAAKILPAKTLSK